MVREERAFWGDEMLSESSQNIREIAGCSV